MHYLQVKKKPPVCEKTPAGKKIPAGEKKPPAGENTPAGKKTPAGAPYVIFNCGRFFLTGDGSIVKKSSTSKKLDSSTARMHGESLYCKVDNDKVK